jgi:predicted cupin superfamily sugar epimerase
MPDCLLEEIIRVLNLKPLPGEGGLSAESYRSSESISRDSLPARYSGSRLMSTAIYYLLNDDNDSFSALHVLKTDETYHFYLGDPVEMLLLLPGGNSQTVILGQDLLGGQAVQVTVPAGVWQGSRLVAGGQFALLGTTMAPGFDLADFMLGERAKLVSGWPQEAGRIRRLTRI